jgi:tetratricopeptide (TPR) repeat protein
MRRHPRLTCVALLLLAVAGRGDWWRDDSAREADRMLSLGREALEREDWDTAEEYADRLIAREQRDHGRMLRGESLYRQHRPESAFEALNKVRSDALRPDAARIQGLCLLEMGNEREADRLFRFVVQHRPNDADAYRGLAAIAYNQGNWLNAEDYLHRVAELAPRDGRPLWTFGLIQQDLALHDSAEKYFREALARDLPGDLPGQVRADLAISLAELKRYAEALQELEQANLPIWSPQQARTQVDCLRSLGRTGEAMVQVDLFLREMPDDPSLIAEKGLILLDSRRASDAVPVLELALSTNPHDRRARDGLRKAYLALGRFEEASKQPRQLAESEALYASLTALTMEAMNKPWDASIRYKLADTCDKLRKPELAEMWRKAARTGERP